MFKFNPLPLTLLAALCGALQLCAQAPAPTYEELLKKVEELSKKVDAHGEELERLKLDEAGSETAAVQPAAVAEGRGSHGLGPAASKVYGVKQGLSIGGYGETLYQNFDDRADNETLSGRVNEWDALRAVVYLGWKFDERFVLNSEIEYEHGTTGKGGEVSVEFLTLDALFHRSFNVRAGVLLAPMGFLNELHEPPVYLGARRPEVESQLIPSTWRMNGAGLFGDLGSGRAAFSYKAYLVESLYGENFAASGLRGGRQSGARAKADDLALSGRLDWHGVAGLTAGVAVFSGKTGQDLMGNFDATPGNETNIDAKLTLWDVHFDWRWRALRTRALYARAKLSDAALLNREDGINPSLTPGVAGPSTGVGSELRGWYAEAGYEVLNHFRADGGMALTPFIRYESLDTQYRVPAGYSRGGANERIVRTLGIDFKPHPQIVLKLDHQNYSNAAAAGGTGVNQWNAALGYLF